MGLLGVQAIAAHTIAFEISIVVLLVAWAVANAVATRIGTISVQEGCAGVWRVLNSSLLIFFLFMLPPMVVLKLFSPWAVMLFVGAGLKAQTLLPTAAPVVVLAAFFVFVNGLRLVLNHALNGLADMKVPALIAAVSYWGIALPVGITLGFMLELGVLGMWWGLITGMSVATVAYFMRFWWLVRHSSLATKSDQ
uniref:MatE protein n=1 Tax=Candidatus Kentrum sp. TUN TaxID=2126343 RepID=A0A451AD88_9GAMM|nr:MAG: MatE protein [Candidatus Kentron sp. TUN]